MVVTGYPAWYHNFRTVSLGGGKLGESDSAWLILSHAGGGGGGVAVSGEERETPGKLNFSKTLKSLGASSSGGAHYLGVNRTLMETAALAEWFSIEGGWLRSSGLFYGLELGLGVSDINTSLSAGFNIGGSYDLPNDIAQLSFGMSLGGWLGYDDRGYTYLMDLAFGGPFVKARWKFIEVGYRGLIGYEESGYTYNGNTTSDVSFAYLGQLKVGLHFRF